MRKDLLPRLQKYEQYQKAAWGPEQFQQDRSRGNVYADERRSHAKWPTETGIQCANRDRKTNLFLNLQYTSKTDRHPLFRAASGKKAQQILGKWPKTVIADAGYGSEEKLRLSGKERDTGGGEVRQLPQGKD
ncbi:hypothetical protein ACFSQ7_51010 [Paenibacillus rhizoplanae]